MAETSSASRRGNTEPESLPPGRRRFIAIALGAIAAAIAGIIGVPLVGFFALPALRRPPRQWLEVGPVSAFAEGKITKALARPVVTQAWPQATLPTAIYVLNHGEERFTLFDLHCTHVGCPVQWSGPANRFFSPCHGGVFDKDGRVLAGPPPRPLDRYESKIENGTLYAGRVYKVNDKLEFAAWHHA